MPRHPVDGTTIKLCRCTRVMVTCRFCGPLVANLDIKGRITVNNLKNYQAFVLRIHNEAFHAVKDAVTGEVGGGHNESRNGEGDRRHYS